GGVRPAALFCVSALLLAILVAALALGLAWGPSAVTTGEAFRALFGADDGSPAADIVRRIRLPRVLVGAAGGTRPPRVLAGALVGPALWTAGAIFQALLRNPLADPFVLGISGGAALGGVAGPWVGAAVGVGG